VQKWWKIRQHLSFQSQHSQAIVQKQIASSHGLCLFFDLTFSFLRLPKAGVNFFEQ